MYKMSIEKELAQALEKAYNEYLQIMCNPETAAKREVVLATNILKEVNPLEIEQLSALQQLGTNNRYRG